MINLWNSETQNDDNVYIIEVNPRSSRTVPFISKATNTPVECKCVKDENDKEYVKLTGDVEACIIVSDSSSGNVNNWLKYGSSEANWRVLGIYSVNGTLYPKMITADVID